MPCICVKEGRKPTKHRIEDIELNSSVSVLKEKAAERLNIPVKEQSRCQTVRSSSLIVLS